MFSTHISRPWWLHLKINFRIFWYLIMKNHQVKHGQSDSIIFPPKIFFWKLWVLLDLYLNGSWILYFWYVLNSVHKFITELHVPQWLFVRWSHKKHRERRGWIISSLLHLSWQPSALGGNLTMRLPFLHPSVWPRRKYAWALIWKQSLLIYFENCQDVPFSYEQG